MPSLRSILELFRLPNVFTAIADVAMGYLITRPDAALGTDFGLLAASSALLYTAGMVLNDVFDVEQDTRERPHRPIPAGRVSLRMAIFLGVEMLVLGIACGWMVGAIGGGGTTPGLVATGLAVAVLMYDSVLKRTPLAPLAMGACRFLNVLLGMSTLAGPWQPLHYAIAGGMGLYIVGVTWFARTEAVESRRPMLAAALLVIIGGLATLSSLPAWELQFAAGRMKFHLQARDWYLLWVLIGGGIVFRAMRAVFEPSPGFVQRAVKHCLVSIIVLDAMLTLGLAGPMPALAVIALLMPMTVLGRWLYST